MTYFKHYSFDLWLTLIKSNLHFKLERAVFFQKHYNRMEKSVDEVITIFRQVDLMANAINEKTGKNLDAEELYLMVISLLNNNSEIVEDIDINHLEIEMQQLLFKHRPLLFSSDTKRVLEELKSKSAASFSISSNTGFIKGTILRQVLTDLQIASLFDFQIYSDEIGLSKPHPHFFEKMILSVKKELKKEAIALDEIIHIGDNIKADIQGAAMVGIKSHQINSNNLSILSLLQND